MNIQTGNFSKSNAKQISKDDDKGFMQTPIKTSNIQFEADFNPNFLLNTAVNASEMKKIIEQR